MSIIYEIPDKLHTALLAAGFPVVGISSDGRIDYSRELTKSEKSSLTAFIAAFDPTPSTAELRQAAYAAKGITADMLIWALWDQIINNDSKKAATIKALMDEIDSKIN